MTDPVANPGKVKRRRRSQALETGSVGEQSYDLEAAANDPRAQRRVIEDGFDSPSRMATTRQKKRYLEQRFRSSAPTLPSPTAPSPRNQLTSHHCVNRTDNSLVFDPEQASLVPSKASQSLNGHIETGLPKRSSKASGSKASGSTCGDGSTTGKVKRKVPLRDTDRLFRSRSESLEQQDSGMPLPRRASQLSQGPPSVTGSTGTSTGRGRSLTKKRGREWEQGLACNQSVLETMDRPSMARSGRKSKGPRSKSVSMDPPTRILTKQQSFSSYGRGAMMKGQSAVNEGSRRSIMARSSQPTVVTPGENIVVQVPVTLEQPKEVAKAGNGTIVSIFKRYFPTIPPMEEKPPRSLVLIWVLNSAQLASDIGSTANAVTQLLQYDTCCGESIELGPIPIIITIPYLLLVSTELALLCRAMVITMWPSLLTDEILDKKHQIQNARSHFMQMFCFDLRWNAEFILRILNFLVLVNAFFGCIIVWMLVYQYDERGCIVVLGLEVARIILHCAKAYLEGSCNTVGQVLFQSIPLIPFVLSVSVVLVSLKKGGVCYLVDQQAFMFAGCELCPNNMPPIDDMCQYNGTNYTVRSDGSIDLNGLDNLADSKGAVTERVLPGDYCGIELPDGPDISFCWYNYSESNN